MSSLIRPSVWHKTQTTYCPTQSVSNAIPRRVVDITAGLGDTAFDSNRVKVSLPNRHLGKPISKPNAPHSHIAISHCDITGNIQVTIDEKFSPNVLADSDAVFATLRTGSPLYSHYLILWANTDGHHFLHYWLRGLRGFVFWREFHLVLEAMLMAVSRGEQACASKVQVALFLGGNKSKMMYKAFLMGPLQSAAALQRCLRAQEFVDKQTFLQLVEEFFVRYPPNPEQPLACPIDERINRLMHKYLRKYPHQ